jgi:hypothetical protein
VINWSLSSCPFSNKSWVRTLSATIIDSRVRSTITSIYRTPSATVVVFRTLSATIVGSRTLSSTSTDSRTLLAASIGFLALSATAVESSPCHQPLMESLTLSATAVESKSCHQPLMESLTVSVTAVESRPCHQQLMESRTLSSTMSLEPCIKNYSFSDPVVSYCVSAPVRNNYWVSDPVSNKYRVPINIFLRYLSQRLRVIRWYRFWSLVSDWPPCARYFEKFVLVEVVILCHLYRTYRFLAVLSQIYHLTLSWPSLIIYPHILLHYYELQCYVLKWITIFSSTKLLFALRFSD